jgi:hypothetical protein
VPICEFEHLAEDAADDVIAKLIQERALSRATVARSQLHQVIKPADAPNTTCTQDPACFLGAAGIAELLEQVLDIVGDLLERVERSIAATASAVTRCQGA